MRVRKQRAETIRDLRSKVKSLAIQEQNQAVKFDSTLRMSTPSSPAANLCPSPVATSPIRSNGRTRWTPCRQDQPLQVKRRRLSESRSPMPLKIRTNVNNHSNSKVLSPKLSPLRANTKLSYGASTAKSPKVPSPARRPIHSPMPTPTRREPFSCLSPKMAVKNRRQVGNDENQRKKTPAKKTALTPRKRRLTPVKATTTMVDRPLSMPKRVRTPPPSCNIRSSRMF